MDQRGIADLAQFPLTPIRFWATGNKENSRKCEVASASVHPLPSRSASLASLGIHMLLLPSLA